VPAARLTEIRRNSCHIVESCAKIKDGESFDPVHKLSDWNDQKNLVHLPARGVEAMLETLASVYDWLDSERRWDLVDDVQVLSARNATRKRLNKDLQLRLNKDGAGNHRVFKVGDKIINLKTVSLFASWKSFGESHLHHLPVQPVFCEDRPCQPSLWKTCRRRFTKGCNSERRQTGGHFRKWCCT
jgi:hypothetical protein